MSLSKKIPFNIVAPLLGMAILTLGNGFFSTLTTIELQVMQYSVWAIGWISTVYFAGMIVGSYFAQNLILRLGHNKAYILFALSLTMAALLQGFFPSVWIWALTRFISAFCLAGLFIVIESWLLAAVHDSQKGQIMAIYLLAYYIIQALSQLLLKINFSAYWMAFGLIAALAAFSIIPIVFAKNAAAITGHSKLASPLAFFKKAPLGVSSGLVAGLMFAMVYTMFPLFLAEAGYPADRIANIMSITLVGGALLQLPIGKISDHCDRRVVITIVSLLLAMVSLLMALTYQHYLILMMLCFIWGGLIFVIYPLSISHTSDCVGRALAVSAVSVITLIYSAGSMLGPLGMSALMSNLGRHGFFAYTIMSCSLLGLYGLYSVVRYRRIPPGQFHASFPEAAIGEQIVESKNQ